MTATATRRPLEERFAEKVDQRGPAECWPWTGFKCPRGYGKIMVYRAGARRMEGAHRVAWRAAHGCSIPPGQVVRHRCDNPACVNPAHLQIGTQRDNIRDMDDRARRRAFSPGGGFHGNAVLTDDQAAEIRRAHDAGEASRLALGAQFGVSQSVIGRVVRGESYKLATGAGR